MASEKPSPSQRPYLTGKMDETAQQQADAEWKAALKE
jgi:hypothetical protein